MLFTIDFIEMENKYCFSSFPCFDDLFLEIEWGDQGHIWFAVIIEASSIYSSKAS